MATLRRSPAFRILLLTALGSIVLMTALPGLAFGLPLVAITRPTNGATVSGVIWIEVAFRSDSNRPITRLEIYIDDALAREADLATPMLEGRQSFNWDFSYAQNTTHKIAARAIDSANASASATVSVQVQNAAVGGPDVIPPVVRIYYPAQGAKLQGLVEVKADATDNTGVELVYFYVDGKLHKMMMNAPPYVDSWDTRREADGVHVLEAVAVDAAELEARSAQVTVIVENHSLTTVGSAPAAPGLAGQSASPAAPSVNPAPPTPRPEVAVPAPWDPLKTPILQPAAKTEQTPGTADGQKVVEIAPRVAAPGPLPAAPSVSSLPASGSPVGIAATHNEQLTTAPAPTVAPRTSSPALARPGALAAVPAGSAAAPSVAKQSPTVTRDAERPSAPRATIAAATPPAGPARVAVAPSGSSTAPRAAAVAAPKLAPAGHSSVGLAKSNAPLGTLVVNPAARTSVPGAVPVAPQAVPARSGGLARVAAAPTAMPAGTQKITPIGPAVALPAAPAREVRPLTSLVPDHKTTPTSGLSRVTPPAPVQPRVASVAKPPLTPAVLSQAALAEYRGLPVPASRMLAMLPGGESAKLPADGRTTTPGVASAAVPLAVQAVRDIKIVFDGEVLSLRTAPDTRQGISIAPLREIFEKTDGVLYWFPVEGKVRAVNKDVDMKLTIGNKKVDVNGETETLQIAPYIKQGRTMVPLQFIADVLDVKIAFDNRTGQILISSNQF